MGLHDFEVICRVTSFYLIGDALHIGEMLLQQICSKGGVMLASYCFYSYLQNSHVLLGREARPLGQLMVPGETSHS